MQTQVSTPGQSIRFSLLTDQNRIASESFTAYG
jgi:hypothetical protein